MKKSVSPILPVILMLLTLMVALSGCVIVTPKQREAELKLKALTTDVATSKTNVAELREHVGATVAENTADLEALRTEQAKLFGVQEDLAYEIEGIRESLNLLSDTIQELENTMNTALIVPGEGVEGAEEPVTISTLKNDIDALTLKVAAMEGPGAAVITGAGAPKAADKPEPSALYMEGLDLIREDREFDKGLSIMQRFLSEYPDNELADNAQYWVGEVHYAKGDWGKAAIEFNKVTKKYPKGDKVAAALLKRGFSFEKLDMTDEAAITFKIIIKRFSKSPEAKNAKKHLKELEKKKPAAGK